MKNSKASKLQQRTNTLLLGLCVAVTMGLNACGGGGGADTNTTRTVTYPSVAAYTSLDLNSPLNYTSPTLLAHYDASVLATNNQTAANTTTNQGATLGRVLFNDARLSFNDTKSCASCHVQSNGFVDQNQFSTGFAGGLTTAHAMRLGNVAFYQGNRMFWDKRATSLEDQATDPIQNAIEMGFDATHGGFSALVKKNANPALLPRVIHLGLWR
jgi:cytochrome c peroxidase